MLGKRIEDCRTALGLSRSDLADRLDVGTNTIFRWEKGERSPSDDMKRRIAEALSTSVAHLMDGDDTRPPTTPQRLNVGINLDDPEVLTEVLSGLRARKIQVPKVESDPNVPFPGEQEPIMPL